MDRFGGEPTLEEVLSDRIVHLVMKADGVDMLRLCETLLKARCYAATASQDPHAMRTHAPDAETTFRRRIQTL
jgi:hypothetical protein